MTQELQPAAASTFRQANELPASVSANEGAKPRNSRRPMVILALAVLAVVAIVVWRGLGAAQSSDAIVLLSGRIEADEATVAPKLSARILEIRVREGDTVKAGDVVAVLDDEQVRAREDHAKAALVEAEARTRAARDQVTVFQQQVQQSQLHTEQSKVDAGGRVSQAEADLAGAEAQLAQQQASYQLALFDKDAYTKLQQSGAVSERQAKLAVSTADQQAAAVIAAERRVEAARGALTTAKANLTNPAIREAETATVRRQLAQQEAEVSSALAQTEQARAQLVEAQANRTDLTIRAPFDGTIVTRSAEPGEVVGPGANTPIEAAVSRIDPQATFTPENTYFREDRVKQVVGVKLQLKGAVGFAKPGMPADGEVLVSGGTWPKAGR